MEVLKEKAKSNTNNTTRAVGGALGLPSRTVVQAQLETTQPGDRYEQEADAAAALVMRRLEGGSFPSPSVQPQVSMPSVGCFGGGGIRLSTQMESQLTAMSGGGHSMPVALQRQMESGFGRSLSDVRLHTDAPAADLSAQLHAKAFAHGNDIYFAHGQYQPETTDGQHLIAHEVAHTMQQSGVVGREEVSGNDMDNYIPNKKDQLWMKKYVLKSRYYEILQNNYKVPNPLDERRPVTIVFYTTSESACRRSDDDTTNDISEGSCAFEENGDYGLRSLLKIGDRVIVSQGKSSLEDYVADMRKIKTIYGPVKDIVIVGHGSPLGQEIAKNVWISTSNSNYFFNEVKSVFDDSDKGGNPLHHTIVLFGCLTAAEIGGYSSWVKSIVGAGVDVVGNLAATYNNSSRFYYDDGRLRLANKVDKKAPIVEGEDRSYKEGRDWAGCLRDIRRRMKNGEKILSSDYKIYRGQYFYIPIDSMMYKDKRLWPTCYGKRYKFKSVLEYIAKETSKNYDESLVEVIDCLIDVARHVEDRKGRKAKKGEAECLFLVYNLQKNLNWGEDALENISEVEYKITAL